LQYNLTNLGKKGDRTIWPGHQKQLRENKNLKKTKKKKKKKKKKKNMKRSGAREGRPVVRRSTKNVSRFTKRWGGVGLG